MYKIVLVKNVGRDGTLPIKLRIIINRKAKYINTGFRVKPYEWNEVKSQVISRHPDYDRINRKLDDLLKQYVEQNDTTGTSISFKDSNDEMFIGKEKEKTLKEIIETRLIREKKRLKNANRKKLQTVLGHLNKTGHAQIEVSKFNLTVIRDLDLFLETECNISANSRKAYHAVIRSTINEYCNDKDVTYDIWNDPYRRFQGEKIREVKKIPLTGDEIHKLFEYMVFHPTYSGRKFDSTCMFVFSFYTCGLRFGDVFNLHWSNLSEDGIIRVSAEKNFKELVIRMNPYQANILKFFTPFRDLFKCDFENRDQVEMALSNIFPRISKLIDYEMKYLSLRKNAWPKRYSLINDLFEDKGIEPLLQIEDDELSCELRDTFEIRDALLTEFLIAYAQHHSEKPIFNFKENKDYNKLDLTLKKESANALVNKELKNVFKELKIRVVSFHHARHAFANIARLSADKDSTNPMKWDIYRISRALGHSSIKVTETYLKGFESSEITSAMDSLIGVMNQYYSM